MREGECTRTDTRRHSNMTHSIALDALDTLITRYTRLHSTHSMHSTHSTHSTALDALDALDTLDTLDTLNTLAHDSLRTRHTRYTLQSVFHRVYFLLVHPVVAEQRVIVYSAAVEITSPAFEQEILACYILEIPYIIRGVRRVNNLDAV